MYNRQHPSIATCFGPFLGHPQANIYLEKVLSARTIHYGIPHCLQIVRKTIMKVFKVKILQYI